MIKWAFIDTIRKGLGKAHTELAAAKNKDEYKDTLEWACFHDCAYDFACEGSKGDYLYDLLSLLDDREYFKQKITAYLWNTLPTRNLFAQLIDILEEFYLDGDKGLKTFFKEYYDRFIAKGKWTKNKKLCYDYLCIVMSRMFGLKQTLKMLDDIERLKIEKDDLFWFVWRVSFRYKKNERVKNFYVEKKKEEGKKEFFITFEEFLVAKEELRHRVAFAYRSTAEEFDKCLAYLQTTDKAKDVIAILREFQYRDCPKTIPEDVLFSLLGKHGQETDSEIYYTLSYIKSKRVERLALTLLNDKEHRVNALCMLMTNYKSEYKALLVKAYKKVRFSYYDYIPLLPPTVDLMYSVKKDLPNEILFYAYEKSYDAFYREYIVDCMKKRNLLTAELLNELQYDSDYDIRKKVKRWSKNI